MIKKTLAIILFPVIMIWLVIGLVFFNYSYFQVVGLIVWTAFIAIILLFAILSIILNGGGRIYCPSCGGEDVCFNSDTGLFICRRCHRAAKASEVIR